MVADKRTRKIRFGRPEPAPAAPVEPEAPAAAEPAPIFPTEVPGVDAIANRLYPMQDVQSEINKLFADWAAPVVGVGLGLVAVGVVDRIVATRKARAKQTKKSPRRRTRRRVA